MCRNHEIKVKLKREELDKIKRKAQEIGVDPAVFLRITGLKSEIEVEANA